MPVKAQAAVFSTPLDTEYTIMLFALGGNGVLWRLYAMSPKLLYDWNVRTQPSLVTLKSENHSISLTPSPSSRSAGVLDPE